MTSQSGSSGGRDPLAGSLAPSLAGAARIGALRELPGVLREFGVEPAHALAQAGVSPRLLDDPDNRIADEDLGRLLSVCAGLTRCEHFGLLLGSRFRLDDFVVLGGLLRNSTTLGEALNALLLHLYLHDRLAVPVLLRPQPSSVLLGYSVQRHGMQAPLQLYGAAIGIAYRLLRELCGPGWKPLHVQFAFERPANVAFYRRFFSSRLCFEAEVSGVLFEAAWLERPIPGAEPARRKAFAQAISLAEAHGRMSFAEQVECVLHRLLLNDAPCAERVAQLFGIRQRTLRLRLQQEGSSLQQLLDRVRFEQAKQLLQNTRLPLAEIAARLRYADPAVFSRAFRGWANCSPRQWRTEHPQLAVGAAVAQR